MEYLSTELSSSDWKFIMCCAITDSGLDKFFSKLKYKESFTGTVQSLANLKFFSSKVYSQFEVVSSKKNH